MRLFFIGILYLLIVCPCMADKSTQNFKSIKKEIDTLIVLPVNAEIAIVGRREAKLDTLLSVELQDYVSNKINSMLGKKYTLVHPQEATNYTKQERKEIWETAIQIDSLKNPIAGIAPPKVLIRMNYSNGYGIFVSVWGHYIDGRNPYDKLRENYYLINSNETSLNISVSIIDFKSNEIIYSSLNSNRDDPRLRSLVDRILLKGFRKIYYK